MERIILDRGDATWNLYARQAAAVIESIVAESLELRRQRDASQRRASAEGIRADARDTIGDGDRRQARATPEGIRADARYTIGDRDARQCSAVTERPRADARSARDHNGFERRGNETTVILIRQSTEDIAEMRVCRAAVLCADEGKRDLFQRVAVFEGGCADACHAVGNIHDIQVIITGKSQHGGDR